MDQIINAKTSKIPFSKPLLYAFASTFILLIFTPSVRVCSDTHNYYSIFKGSWLFESISHNTLFALSSFAFSSPELWILTLKFCSYYIYFLSIFRLRISPYSTTLLLFAPFSFSLVGLALWNCGYRNGISFSILAFWFCTYYVKDSLSFSQKFVRLKPFLFLLFATLIHWSSIFDILLALMPYLTLSFKRLLAQRLPRSLFISIPFVAILYLMSFVISGNKLFVDYLLVLSESDFNFGRFFPLFSLMLQCVLLFRICSYREQFYRYNYILTVLCISLIATIPFFSILSRQLYTSVVFSVIIYFSSSNYAFKSLDKILFAPFFVSVLYFSISKFLLSDYL